jgi:hypothetical protein
MKVTFEIKTTCSKPFHITVSEEVPVFELRKIVVDMIEYNTILCKDDVVDLFIPHNNDCISILELSSDTVKSFIQQYPEYFHTSNSSIWNNIHQLYVMDTPYLEKIKSKKDSPIYTDFIPPTNTVSSAKTTIKKAFTLLTGLGIVGPGN